MLLRICFYCHKYEIYWISFYNPNFFLCSCYVWLYNCTYDKTYHLKQIYNWYQNKLSLVHTVHTPRCVPAVCSRRTGPNRDDWWRNSSAFIQCSAPDQTRFGEKSDHGLSLLCYGLRRYIPVVAPGALRCVLVRPDSPRLCPGHRRHNPGVTTASHRSRTHSPGVTRWHMNINVIPVELITYMLFANYRKSYGDAPECPVSPP